MSRIGRDWALCVVGSVSVVLAAGSCRESSGSSERVAVTRAAATTSTSLSAVGDTYLRVSNANSNLGGELVLNVQTTGRNRTLLFFDVAAIQAAAGAGTLLSATLELTIDSPASNWGAAGRPIAVHRLKQASAELSATWNCAIDASVQNSQADCSGATAWNMAATDPAVQPWQSPATATAVITTGQTGVVTFDVTADVAAIANGTWPGHGFLIKKVEETLSGAVAFVSRERGPAPRLVLQVEVPDPPSGGTGGSGQAGQGGAGGSMDGGAMDAGVTSQRFVAVKDTQVRMSTPNQNYGVDPVLDILASGRHRALVNFDAAAVASAVGQSGLVSAKLELTIVQTYNNWGADRSLGAHRLRHDWTELGATWNCTDDPDPTNPNADDCTTPWTMWAPELPEEQIAWRDQPTGIAIIASEQTGIVEFDVTHDVACQLAGFTPWHGWLVKKEAESQSGHIEFASRETATAPALIVEYGPGPGLVVTAEQCGAASDAGVPDAGSCEPTGPDDDCDGVDDDCDGTADDGYAAQATSCGVGACASTGSTSCADGQVQNSCTPGTPAANDVTCDGVDDDCSGAADEDYVSQNTSCGVGACASTGSTSCVGGQVQDSCTPGTSAANDASCNGVDDDCSGSNDEDYISLATTCGIGACVRSGSTSCDAGTVLDSCQSGAPAADDTTCDQVDDDCDDETDEGCESACADGLDNDADSLPDCRDSDCAQAPECGIGTPCTEDADCAALGAEAQCLLELPGGYCVRPCDFGDPVAPCPEGSFCLEEQDVCVLPCDENDECEDEAHECAALPELQAPEFCRPSCQQPCALGMYCEPQVDFCLACELADTACDGLDNDCDGTADEDYVPVVVSCGVGACAATGSTSCVNGSVAESCTPGTAAANDVSCNGADDDCNGATDEDYTSIGTSCGTGTCASTGSTSCVGGAVQDSCTPGVPAANDASCNGVDDDCSGSPDEDYVSLATSCGVGACTSAGSTSCVGGAVQDSCTPGTPAPNDASCNGVDDDCSGTPDEDYAPVATTCGAGACASTGVTSCESGAVQDSCTQGEAEADDATCDGEDADCDGLTDEDYAPHPTSCGRGVCASAGITSCVEGEVLDSCVAGISGANDTACDDEDSDCDGFTDEAYVSEPTSCGVGACVRAGATSCVDGEVVDSCAPGTPEHDTTCDGVDDDCDGTADEGYVSVQTNCGIGACAALGTTSCQGGTVVDSCTPAAPSFADPTCNAFDDDCDGALDENYAPHPTTCGLGQCVSSGVTSCVGGNELDSCTPGSPGADDTTCDGLDSDCNGTSDEDYLTHATSCGFGPCAATGVASCVAGHVQDSCVPPPATAPDTDCDDIDDDCDGETDEAYAPVVTFCGLGVCRRPGTTACVDGEIEQVCTPGSSTGPDTSCNGIDEDCDGANDDAYPSDPALCGVGVCQRQGGTFCEAGQVVIRNCQPGLPTLPEDTTCNGIDEDCDVLVDEEYASLATSCGVGACSSSGATSCVTGHVIDSCEPQAPQSDDDCDGVDDDCDGEDDDDFPSQPTTCGLGPCAAQGKTYCYRGIELDSCQPGAAAVNDATCDGIDNDCSGEVDEDFPRLLTGETCGVGACERQERQACVSAVAMLECVPGAPAADDASCDGVDDDCDGSADEDYESLETTCGTPPELLTGATSCIDGEVVDSCLCVPSATSDTACNLVDDDCDGHLDEDYLGVPTSTTCGTGACATIGRMQCVLGNVIDVCIPGDALLDDTSCNLFDDDCDTLIDEDYITLETECGVGNCEATGITLCISGTVEDTCEPPLPEADVDLCGDEDEDCDGNVDEDFAAAQTHCGEGPCAATGVSSCVDGELLDSCVPGTPGVGDGATCNGVDEDCDGALDEDFVSTPTGCGVPPYDNTGAIVCTNGEVIDTCVPCQDLGDEDPTCDGNDDDCDHLLDDEYVSHATTCGLGVCARSGASACVNGQETSNCVPGAPTGDDRNCNGVDEDCDGVADDGFADVAPTTTCGTGACERAVPSTCVAGVVYAACAPGTPGSDDVSCDGFDDDCDGALDEDYLPACSGTAVAVCAAGSLQFISCVDEDACTLDSCSSATCVHATASCNDGSACTADSCDPDTGCVHDALTGAACDDQDVCTSGETCNSVGACQPEATVDPDDGDPCTVDSCDPVAGTLHTAAPRGSSCSDSELCNGFETCRGPCVEEPSGVSHWWTADGTPSALVGGLHAVIEGNVDYGSGVMDQAFGFHAVAGERVRVLHNTTLDLNVMPAASFSGWFRATVHGVIVAKHQCGFTNGWFYRTDQGCYFNNLIGSTAAPVNLLDGQYHHFACVKNGNSYSEYIDGALWQTATLAVAPVNTIDVQMGGSTGGTCTNTGQLNGNIDEVQLYSRALTTAEVAGIWQSRTQGGLCKEATTCVPGTPPVLDDQNPCTVDACDPSLGAVHTPAAAGTPCSPGTQCDGAGACVGAPSVAVGNGQTVTVNGGFFSSVSVATGGTLNVTGNLSTSALSMTGGALQVLSGAHFQVLAGGTPSVTGGTLTNRGTFVVPTFDGSSFSAMTFLNYGRLDVLSNAITIGSGVTLSESGTLGASDSIGSLTVLGTLTHEQSNASNTGPLTGGLSFTVTGNATVGTPGTGDTGSIDVTGKGLLPQQTYAANLTTIVTGATGGVGGSHGGPGGGASASTVYGSMIAPVLMGSGGGNSNGFGGSGGGRVDLVVNGTLTLNGTGGVKSNGTGCPNCNVGENGGGAGGSLRLRVGVLAGAGPISASGGDGRNWSGGGGRIAVEYASRSHTGTLSAASAGDAFQGGIGTVYLKDTLSGSTELLLSGTSPTTTPITADGSFARISMLSGIVSMTGNAGGVALVMSGGTLTLAAGMSAPSSIQLSGGELNVNTTATMAPGALTMNGGTFTVGETGHVTLPVFDATTVSLGTFINRGRLDVLSNVITIGSGVTLSESGTLGSSDSIGSLTVLGTLTHEQRNADNTSPLTGGLSFTVTGNATVDNAGSIDVTGRGLLPQQTYAADLTTIVTGATGGIGGSHGGPGSGASASAVYGSMTAPVLMGSGGGNGDGYGGSGGGRIDLVVNGTLTVNGTGGIRANGGMGCGFCSLGGNGGGAGGSVRLRVGTLAGAAPISANGATGRGSIGGGGRIAVDYASRPHTGTLLAAGGGNAGIGTVFLHDTLSGSTELLLSGISPTTTPITADGSFAKITMLSGTVSMTGNAGGVALVMSGGTLTLAAGMSAPSSIQLSGGELNVNTTATMAPGALSMSGGTFTVGEIGHVTLPVFDATTVSLGTFINRGRLDVTSNAITIGSGVTLSESGALGASDSIGSLTVLGTLTHEQRNASNTGPLTGGLSFTVTGNATVDNTGSIDVTGKGLLPQQTYAADLTTIVTGATGGTGGSHGGPGGGASLSAVYGSPTAPVLMGSGGGNDNGFGGAGGGRVDLVVNGTLTVNGTGGIRANGGIVCVNCNAGDNGGGAGGSVRLRVGTLAGAAPISANGAIGRTSGGGGGRIAVDYALRPHTGTLSVAGAGSGAPGTVQLTSVSDSTATPALRSAMTALCRLQSHGDLACWGDDSQGLVSQAPAGVYTRLTAGIDTACVLHVPGQPHCWGEGDTGLLDEPLVALSELGLGQAAACGLRASGGTILCWGSGSSSLQSAAPAGAFTGIEMSATAACARNASGVLSCFGDNTSGQVSLAPSGAVTSFDGGLGHFCAVMPDQSLLCWGNNNAGQAQPPSGSFVKVTAGAAHSCALTPSGTAVCWGDDSHGQVSAPPDVFDDIAAGSQHTCGVLQGSGALLCWGNTCQVNPSGVIPVDDGNPCTADECLVGAPLHVPTPGVACPNNGTCNEDGACEFVPECATAANCSDGDACNGTETCNLIGLCRPGTPPVVDDGNPCTVDVCDPPTGVTHTPQTGLACSDDTACTVDDACDATGACAGDPVTVPDDADPCTRDFCHPQAGVLHVPTPGNPCGDGNACNGDEVCGDRTHDSRTVQVEPEATYLLAGGSLTRDARAHRVRDFGLEPGDRALIRRVGSFESTPLPATQDLLVVFSSTDVLLPNDRLVRVPDAVATAGRPPVVTSQDISQDFLVNEHEILIEIPDTAAFFFVAAAHGGTAGPGSNIDLDGDWGFVLTPETQLPVFGCQPAVAPTLDDGDPCTVDSCSPSGGVAHTVVAPGSLSCAELGAECGSVLSCGTPLDCGQCTAPAICGGQSPNRCGPASLAVQAAIGIAKGRNVAALEDGAAIVRPSDGGAAIDSLGTASAGGYVTATDTNPKVFDVDFVEDQHVVDHVSFGWSGASIPVRAQVWLTSRAPFEDNIVLVADQVLDPDAEEHVVPFMPARARFLRVVLLPVQPGMAFGGRIYALRALTRDREGGILSLLEGGAQVASVTSQATDQPARSAIDFDAASFWQTSPDALPDEELLVRLSPQGYPITRVELRSASGAAGHVQNVALSVSDDTDDASDFVPLLDRTLPATGQRFVSGVPASDAAYVKLHVGDVHTGGSAIVRELRVYSDGLGGARVPFDDLTELDETEIASRSWDFGDGNSSTLAHPVHTYAQPGLYTVTLTVTDIAGRVGVARKDYRVLEGPVASFEVTGGEPLHEHNWVSLLDTSVATGGQRIVQRTWRSPRASFPVCTAFGCSDVGEQISTPAYTASAFYDRSGPTTIDLEVVDSQMLTAQAATRPLDVINVPPTIVPINDVQAIWGEPARIGTAGHAVSDVSDADRATLSCTWDYGDGSPVLQFANCHNADLRLDHVYHVPGSFVATLTVVDDVSSTSESVAVEIDRRPTRLVTLGLAPTAQDGDFEVTAELFDVLLSTAPMPGLALTFEYGEQSITATTNAQGVATAVLHFEQLSYGDVRVSFAGDELFVESEDVAQYIVREGDTEPQVLEPEVLGNEGHTFVLGFPQDAFNSSNTENPRNVVVLYLSARKATTARVEVPGFAIDRVVPVVPGETTRVDLPVDVRMAPLDFDAGPNDVLGATTDIEEKGIRVTSDDLIMVQTFESVGVAESATTTTIPAERLGTEYLVTAYRNESWYYYPDPRSSMVAIVAPEDGTTVTITPTADIRPGGFLPDGARRGVPITVTLDSLQTLQLVADNVSAELYEDMTGTEIRSDKPISVYGGSTCTTAYQSTCDIVVEHMPPTRSWGSRFIVHGLGNPNLLGDVLRVLAAQDDTDVYLDGRLYATLDRGEHWHWDIGPVDLHELTASKPVLVSQLVKSLTTLDCGRGDPAMVLVPPVDRFVGESVISTPPNDPVDVDAETLFASTVVLTAPVEHVGALRVDGEPVTDWRVVPGTEFAVARKPIVLGNHHITSEVAGVRFGSMIYGIAMCDGHAYVGGLRAEPLQPGCVPTVSAPGDGEDNDCDGVREEELLNGVDDDGDGVRDEDLALDPHDAQDNTPPVIGGQTVGFFGNEPVEAALTGFDADRDPLTYSIVGTPPAGVTLSGALLRFAGTGAANNVDVSVRANDGFATSAPATVRFTRFGNLCRTAPPAPPITTNVCNDAPYVWGGSAGTQVILVGENDQILYSSQAHFFDFNEHEVVYELMAPSPEGMLIDPASGVIQWVVSQDDIGDHLVGVRATDSLGASAEYGFELTVETDSGNIAPVIESDPITEAVPGAQYAYPVVAHDPDSSVPVTYSIVAGPAAMTVNALGEITWTPLASDVGQHAVIVRVTDWEGTSTNQPFTITVLGSPLQFTSTPTLVATIGEQYTYQASASRATPPPAVVSFDLDLVQNCGPGGCATYGAPAGMQLDTAVGRLIWTPAPNQLGIHDVRMIARDEQGNVVRQFWSIQVVERSVAPRISTQPVTSVVLGGLYFYDVNAADLGAREFLRYALLDGPPDMVIDPVTGVIQWIAGPALGSELITIRVTDSTNLVHTQSFVLEIEPDVTPPVLTLTATPERAAPGEDIVIAFTAHDDVDVLDAEVSLDGFPVTLDGDGRAVIANAAPGVHRVVATATDPGGNDASLTIVFAIEDAADVTAPNLTLTSPAEDAELTYLHEVQGSVTDANLLSYRIELLRNGTGEAPRVIVQRFEPVSPGVLGTLDTTLLENGYYTLRVVAEDVNGAETTVERPIRVEGQAKPGIVQLAFTDMAVSMAGIPLTLGRGYDSRDARVAGDFGYGWSLNVRQGSVSHNRPVGENLIIYTPEQDLSFPCTGVYEKSSHYTVVRVSEREQYIFRPVVFNPEPASGGCNAEVGFELVEGSTAGAELFVLGGDTETLVHNPDPEIIFNPEFLDDSNLVYALDPERGVWNPSELRLELRDGRKFDIHVQHGITYIEDRHGNSVSFASNGIHHSGGKSLFFTRDLQGRISRAEDSAGRSVQYAYDLRGDLVRVTDPLGRATRFVYSQAHPHHLDTIIGPDGTELAALGYDAGGRLNETCDAEGGCTESSYDLAARTVTQTDATARPIEYTYDARGNVVSQTDALDHTVTFQYDAQDNLTRAEGPDGSVATYTYDPSGNLLTRVLPYEPGEDPADFTYTYTYNARNDRESATLPSGGVIDYQYDAAGNLTATKDGAGNVIESRTYNADGTLATRTDRFGTVHYAGYEGGQPTQITDPFGAVISLDYDDRGLLLSRTERGLTTTMTYDALGRMLTADHGHGATVEYEYRDPGENRWTAIEGPTFGRVQRTFSASGRLNGWIEPNGDEFTRLYDASGRVSEEIDALGNSTTYGYDAAGRLETITDVALNATTTFERDSAGRVTKTIDALQNETETAYKLGGRLQSTTNARGFTTSFDRDPTSSSITDALTRTTVTSLTALGLPTSTSYPGGASTSSDYLGTTRLDGSQSFPTSFQDELSRSRDFGYDVNSGLRTATDLAGEQWQYDYVAAAATAIRYDVFSGDVSAGQHGGGASAYQSSAAGTEYRDVSAVGGNDAGFTHMLSRVTSPLGETTRFERGPSGRIERVLYAGGGQKLITYGPDGQPDQVTLPQGTVMSFAHDESFREISRTTSLGETRSFTYGPGDRIETMTDATGTTTYEYDAAGRFTGLVYPHGGSVRYDRDDLDRTTAVRVKTTASAPESVTSYAYDENGNLEQITDPLDGITQYVYDEVDRLVERTLPNGVTTTYVYDDRDRVLSVVHRGPMNNVLASVTYIRSDSGEPTRITREDGGYVVLTYDAALRVDTETYYNAAGQLLDANDYDYDADGNRTSKNSLSGGFESYAYQPGFKLASIAMTAGTETYGYDGGGRNTTIVRGGVERELEYNSDDKVTRVLDDGSEVVAYTYDGVGRRVAKAEDGASVRYLVAPNLGDGFETPQAVTDGSGAVLARFVFAGEHPIARITGGGAVEYYLQDAMGSVIGMADASGASAGSIKYDAFGNVTSISGSAASIPASVGTDFRYHGMQLDAASGLYHVRARTYDSRTGRFTSRDPIAGVTGQPETLNPYVFNHNCPHVWRDPSGTFSLLELTATMAIVSVLASTAATAVQSHLNEMRGYRAGWNTGVGQAATDELAAIADVLSFGLNAAIRDLGGIGNGVNEQSSAYHAGTAIGVGLALLQGNAVGAAAAGRGATRFMGAGGSWRTIDEVAGGAVGQSTSVSCGAACGEMLAGIPQAELIASAGAPTNVGALAGALGNGWRGGYVGPGQLSRLAQLGPWAAELYAGGRLGHLVVVEGIENGMVLIRDPWGGGSTYRMLLDDFLEVWSGNAVFR